MTIYKLTNPPHTWYASRQLVWCWCSKPNSKNEFRAIGTWASCRETIAMDIKRDVLSKKSKYNLDMKTARIISRISVSGQMKPEKFLQTKKAFMAKMQRAVNFVNILESKHGWQLTKAHEVECVGQDGNAINIVCLFTGSPKWLRSPHMVSMWLLILRNGGHKYLWNPKTYGDLRTKMDKYLENTKTSDATYMRMSYPYWNSIMENYDKLFKGFPVSRNYNPLRAWCGHDTPNEGIHKLCKGVSADQDLKSRFKNVCKAQQ